MNTTIDDKVNRANGISFLVHTSLAVGNEYLQSLAGRGAISYMPFMGYLSDFSAPAAAVALSHFANFEGAKVPLFWSAVFTSLEFTSGGLVDGSGTFDPLDIAMYCAGAAMAYVTHKFFGGK